MWRRKLRSGLAWCSGERISGNLDFSGKRRRKEEGILGDSGKVDGCLFIVRTLTPHSRAGAFRERLGN